MTKEGTHVKPLDKVMPHGIHVHSATHKTDDIQKMI